MTAGEYQTQPIVAHRGLLVQLVDRFLGGVQQHGLRVLVLACRLPAQTINRAIARRRDDPTHWTRRRAAHWPSLERDDERVLHRLLGDVDVAKEPHEHRHRAAMLFTEDALDVDQRLPSLNGRTSIGSVVARAILAAQPSAASRSGASTIVMPPRNSLPSTNGPSVMSASSSFTRTTVAVLG